MCDSAQIADEREANENFLAPSVSVKAATPPSHLQQSFHVHMGPSLRFAVALPSLCILTGKELTGGGHFTYVNEAPQNHITNTLIILGYQHSLRQSPRHINGARNISTSLVTQAHVRPPKLVVSILVEAQPSKTLPRGIGAPDRSQRVNSQRAIGFRQSLLLSVSCRLTQAARHNSRWKYEPLRISKRTGGGHARTPLRNPSLWFVRDSGGDPSHLTWDVRFSRGGDWASCDLNGLVQR
ncbi:hypothetical protein EK21DRAFT_94380 [Setomelanomma holmii]|uniref:Uncharacterized protein n=1 Tax=Setomelanomma holmii TaxID=210430 RepID=A0A9P4GY21_9PLEO|nr:hypothetical protein EK21DRAFT_94380 [Setomelanomma holmii]